MKKFLTVLVLIAAMIMGTTFASENVIEVKLNDKYIDFTDEKGNKVEPALINDRTMVPMRKIFEVLGADIAWDGVLQKVTATTTDKKIILQIGNKIATIENLETNEIQEVELDAEPVILNERTMVPARFVAESLEKQVGWDDENKVVVILDYTDLLNSITEKCSNYLEMKSEQTVTIDTWELIAQINGTLEYKDKDNSKNNQTLKLSGTIDYKQGEEATKLELELETTGKGTIKDTLKENDYDEITLDIISDFESETSYLKSSIFEEETKGKWIKINNQSVITKNSIGSSAEDIKETFILDEKELNKDSYENLVQLVDDFIKFFGNDKVKIKRNGTTSKTYTLTLDINDLLLMYKENIRDDVKEILEEGNTKIEIQNTYKNGMNTKGKVTFETTLNSKETKETLNIKIELEAKFDSYNEKVRISIPKSSKIYEG